jgi:GNAT superfamily N-acetyltransferase
MIDVQVPTTLVQLDHVRDLIRTFIEWHRARHQQDRHLIDAYFDSAAFETELATLPGKYAPAEGGGLWLATVDGAPAGCVALRQIDAQRCEMKRMFVYPEQHGRGVGRALADVVIAGGRDLGYQSMLLDTSIRQAEAQALYRRMGFRDVAPYYDLPADLRDWLVFMERPLVA